MSRSSRITSTSSRPTPTSPFHAASCTLTPRKEGRGPHLPVDFLFRSLAEDEQTRAIGVVLSGTGSDGTLGLSEIKAIGGITFAQDEKTAGHSGMPRSAIDSGCVDFVLSPAQIADRLGEIGEHPYLAPDPTQPLAGPTAAESYQRILAVVHGRHGRRFPALPRHDHQAKDPATHGIARPALHQRIRRPAEERCRRGRRAVSRPADQRDELLSRPDDVRGAQGRRFPPDRR